MFNGHNASRALVKNIKLQTTCVIKNKKGFGQQHKVTNTLFIKKIKSYKLHIC